MVPQVMKRTNCAMRYYSTTYQYIAVTYLHVLLCTKTTEVSRSWPFGDLGSLGYVERSNIESLNHT
jgi:hypothetical protein